MCVCNTYGVAATLQRYVDSITCNLISLFEKGPVKIRLTYTSDLMSLLVKGPCVNTVHLYFQKTKRPVKIWLIDKRDTGSHRA